MPPTPYAHAPDGIGDDDGNCNLALTLFFVALFVRFLGACLGVLLRVSNRCFAVALPACPECHRHAAELADGEEEICNTCIMHHEQQRRARSKTGKRECTACAVDKPPQEYAPAERSKVARTCKACQKLPLCGNCLRHFPHKLLVEGWCASCAPT